MHGDLQGWNPPPKMSFTVSKLNKDLHITYMNIIIDLSLKTFYNKYSIMFLRRENLAHGVK